jgi:four helix bundle protein
MQNFRNLRVWHAAHEMSVNITNSFPERYAHRSPGLRSQIIRSAQSVPSNIAEGCGRNTQAEFLQFIEVAIASANELEGHLLYARDTRQLSEPNCELHCNRVIAVRKMLIALRTRVQQSVAIEMNAKRSKAS